MAENQETSLIGYDPLVWLNDPVEELNYVADTSTDPADGIGSAKDDTQIDSKLPDLLEVAENRAAELTTVKLLESEDAMPAVTAITLDSILNIRNVVDLHGRLCLALDCSNKIDIDASAVTVVDTANLQLLLIFKQTAFKMQKQVVIDFPSDKFIEACNLLGISSMLEVDQAVSGFF
jgi:anti-anti-sigma regulatory factor